MWLQMDRGLKEQAISCIGDKEMMKELIRTYCKKLTKITSEQALCWAKRVQKALLESIKGPNNPKNLMLPRRASNKIMTHKKQK